MLARDSNGIARFEFHCSFLAVLAQRFFAAADIRLRVAGLMPLLLRRPSDFLVKTCRALLTFDNSRSMLSSCFSNCASALRSDWTGFNILVFPLWSVNLPRAGFSGPKTSFAESHESEDFRLLFLRLAVDDRESRRTLVSNRHASKYESEPQTVCLLLQSSL
jgi:hypothetical protein